MASKQLCAWCLHDAGITPKENESHGVCKRHAELMMREAEQRRTERKQADKRAVNHV